MTESISKRPLTQLNLEIEQAEGELVRLEADRAAIAGMESKASQRLRLLKIARWTRKPTVSYDLKPVVVLGVESSGVAILVFILMLIPFGSFSLAFLSLLISFVVVASILGVLLFKPTDELLPATISEAESHHQLLAARHKEKVERITETKTRLNRLLEERRDQVASGKLQKAALLQRKWKTMQETEWQDFVVEVCRTLEAKVERIEGRGDDDSNLIADFGPRRIAILTGAKDHNVSSATIHSALAAKARHRCDSCAVIINRRFTGAAQEFAKHNSCTAIGISEFPDFVMGKIEL